MIAENNHKHLSILVTDDNPSQRSFMIGFLRHFFSKSPFMIKEVSDGDQAVSSVTSKISQEHKNFDLIIMDYEMPTLNGQEATRLIRQLEKDLSGEQLSKIITWSSAWNTPFKGADIALRKRFSPMEFVSTLAALGYEKK